MVRMIPSSPRSGANVSERKIFTALEGIVGHDDWIVIHSLGVTRHRTAFVGEADFIVLAPGRGIAVIEAKSPKSVKYERGDWYLEGTPSPSKDPLKQLDGVRRSVRGYLRELGLLNQADPLTRLVWFTSLGRHQFENGSAGDLQLFEWELGWKDDLSKPAWLLEHLFTEFDNWYSQVDAVEHEPAGFTVERAEEIANALLGNFHVSESVADRLQERMAAESALLAEQEFVLELTERNPHIYFDGPAGTGKSHLIAEAARRSNRAGKRTLVTCWNVLMAGELEAALGLLPNIDALNVNALLLQVAGLTENPADAQHEWFTETLPQRALEALQKDPSKGCYETILVDEFQDIAGFPAVIQVLDALCGGGSAEHARVVLAGDSRQQIMRRAEEQVDAFQVAKEWIPTLVNARVARNCRNTPAITSGVQKMMPQTTLGFTSHRMPASVGGGLTVRDASTNETGELSTALRELLQEYSPGQIVVLSPFAENRSLVGRLLARTERSRGERWLRKQLESPDGEGKIRWRSVFKFKGLDADAIVLTDIGEAAKQFTADNGLSFTNLLYVGLTRAKYRCIVLTSD